MSTQPRSIAARAAHWSARHRKAAILGWLAFVIAAYMLGGGIGTKKLTAEEAGVGDSGRASEIVGDAYPDQVGETVLVSSKTLKASDPAFVKAVTDVRKRLAAVRGVEQLKNPYDEPDRAISKDGHAALVAFTVPGDYVTDPKVKAIVDRTVEQTKAAAKGADPALIVEQFGSGSSEEAFMDVFRKDLAKAGGLSLPLTMLILLVTFGTFVAAGLPLLLAITGVLATMGLVGPLSQLMPVDESISHVILLIGLAVGVDYALFYVRRMREERAAGRDADAALQVAAATSGRAVLVSGLTVMVAMAGMYLAGAPTFTSFATGSITVVAVAMLGSITVLPAVLSKLGDRIERFRVPGVGRLKRGAARVNIWSRVIDAVMRRPLVAAVLATGALVAMAVPALQLDTGNPDPVDSLPKDEPVVQTYQRVLNAFPAERGALTVVVRGGDVTRPQVADAVEDLAAGMRRHPDLFVGRGTPQIDVNPGRDVATVGVDLAGNGMDKRSEDALDVLREELVPATLGKVDGLDTFVDGNTAQARDFNDVMVRNLPWVVGFVLLAAFLLLLVTFRSIVVPIKAIVLNLLSVGAAYGAMVKVFQDGWFKDVLGFAKTGPIVAWLPMFLFVVLFGLSMDYHVFVLSRVKELVDRGVDTGEAVSRSIRTTAGVVTSAAVVMVGVFGLFATLSFVEFKQLGVGLAFAVLLDATLIRGVLLPASMRLLGNRNWWLPRRLQWLPKVAHEPTPA